MTVISEQWFSTELGVVLFRASPDDTRRELSPINDTELPISSD